MTTTPSPAPASGVGGAHDERACPRGVAGSMTYSWRCGRGQEGGSSGAQPGPVGAVRVAAAGERDKEIRGQSGAGRKRSRPETWGQRSEGGGIYFLGGEEDTGVEAASREWLRVFHFWLLSPQKPVPRQCGGRGYWGTPP